MGGSPAGSDLESVWPDAFAWGSRHRPEDYMRDRLRSLWESRESGDFVLDVRGDKLRVHGCMLAAASPVFNAMLTSDMRERQEGSASVDADPDDVLALVRFAYLGELGDVLPSQLPGILQLGHAYEMAELIPLCCDMMIRNLSADTVVPFVRALRLLEGVPMDLHRPRPLEPAPSKEAPLSWLQASAAPAASLFGAPPEQPQQANVGHFFRNSMEEQPQQPQQTNGVGFFSGQRQQQPRQPAVSRQPQLLTRAAVAASQSTGEVASEVPAAAQADGQGVEARRAAEDRPQCSPIAHTFVTVAKLIGSSPELQMATLRSL